MFFVRILFFSVVLKICLLYILVIVLFIVVNYYVNCFIDFYGCGNFLGLIFFGFICLIKVNLIYFFFIDEFDFG